MTPVDSRKNALAHGLGKRCIPLSALLLCCLMLGWTSIGHAEDIRDPSVGAAGIIKQIILPGSELIAKPLKDHPPIVVRVIEVFPHGDSFRYDLQFHGMEPGKYNLAEWLERKDGSTTSDLPEIPVEIRSLLPPGQIEPNDLDSGWLPRLGGYQRVMIAAIILWSLVLLGLIFAGHKKNAPVAATEKKLTLADLLQSRLQKAVDQDLPPQQFAELERMLFAFWRERLDLQDRTPEQALKIIHQDEKAGPLMKQLELWMHSPQRDQDVDLAQLVKPFRDMPADTPGFDA